MSLLSRVALVLSALLLSACLDFDGQLGRCRDAGRWVCGGDGDGGGDGGPTGDEDAGLAGLSCNRGWCWEHPRPSGVALRSIWGTSASDLWVGGDWGTLLHFDGTTWTSRARDPSLDFTTLCGHDGAVYFGAATNSGNGQNRLLRWTAGAFAEVPGTTEDIRQLACGSALWIARERGASRLDWSASTPTSLFSVANERCTSIAERSTTECVVGCMGVGVGEPFVRLRGRDGGVGYEVVDAGQGPSFGVRALWKDPNRGVLAGITGDPAEIWQDDGGWSPAWRSSGLGDPYAGAPYASGSIAVGAGGTVVDLDATGATASTLATSGNSYLFGVWSPPSGDAWVVGERGCIYERTAGRWASRSDCAVGFEDFSLGAQVAAISDDALYRRTGTGWEKVRDLPKGQRALWQNPADGGFAFLALTALRNGETTLATRLTQATAMQVVSEARVVILNEGGLLETNLRDGAASPVDAGLVIFTLTGEPDGTVWAGGARGQVLRSTSAGAWTTEDTGLTGDLVDVAAGFGRVWALSSGGLATRAGGTWATVSTTLTFGRVVPLDADTALLLRGTEAALRINSSGSTSQADPPPTRLSGRIERRGNELWAAGWEGGIVRFALPAP